jgi:hypothetical protein
MRCTTPRALRAARHWAAFEAEMDALTAHIANGSHWDASLVGTGS